MRDVPVIGPRLVLTAAAICLAMSAVVLKTTARHAPPLSPRIDIDAVIQASDFYPAHRALLDALCARAHADAERAASPRRLPGRGLHMREAIYIERFFESLDRQAKALHRPGLRARIRDLAARINGVTS